MGGRVLNGPCPVSYTHLDVYKRQIVLTIEEEDRIVSKFMAAGADDYSLKPIKAVDLISRIKVHLQYHEKSQYYENYDKGISKVTLQKIEEQMQKITEFMDIDVYKRQDFRSGR